MHVFHENRVALQNTTVFKTKTIVRDFPKNEVNKIFFAKTILKIHCYQAVFISLNNI